jgi:hypothetical protein
VPRRETGPMPATTDLHQRPVRDAPPRRWPVTAAIVLVGWCLLAWTVFGAAINTAPFFGDTPSRSQYVESGMLCLTALLPLVLVMALGVLWGSRWGLLLLALPAALLVPFGLSMLAHQGDPGDAAPGRPVRVADAFTDLTWLNWGASGVLLLLLAAVLASRRRASRRAASPTT